MYASGGQLARRRYRRAMTFVAGAIAGGVALCSALAVVGGLLVSQPVLLGVAAALSATVLAHHTLGRPRLARWERLGRQASRRRVFDSRWGGFYFGAELGFAARAEKSTPLVYAGWALAAALGLAPAVAYGLGFGAGRSAPVIAGAAHLGPHERPHQITVGILLMHRKLARRAAVATAFASLCLIGLTTAGLVVAP